MFSSTPSYIDLDVRTPSSKILGERKSQHLLIDIYDSLCTKQNLNTLLVGSKFGHKEKQKKKLGRPTKLIIEDQILLTLQYLREYRTYYHIGQDWKISESSACRIVLKIENILIQSRKFSLPGKKKLLDTSLNEELILMDVMESPIERPQKYQKSFYSGKQKQHTLKTQVVFGQKTNQIIGLDHSKGKTHDFKLFKNSRTKFHKLLKVIADKGYQGIAKIHNLSETPIKKPRGKKLSKDQKKYNRELNRLRIAVEHVNLNKFDKKLARSSLFQVII